MYIVFDLDTSAFRENRIPLILRAVKINRPLKPLVFFSCPCGVLGCAIIREYFAPLPEFPVSCGISSLIFILFVFSLF